MSQESIKATFPAGEYYIGDLCYVMHDEWTEVCELMFGENDSGKEGKFTLNDGREYFLGFTAYGDGEYYDQECNRYPVDAGLLGIIAVKDIDRTVKQNDVASGNLYTFESAFEVAVTAGEFNFGHVYINTLDDYEDDYYDDEDDYYTDEYYNDGHNDDF